jgi:N-glycosylase/DNA lyase
MDEHGARRLRAAAEAARVLKPFGGDGARAAQELLTALEKHSGADTSMLKAVEAALLGALMDTRVKSKVQERKSAFLRYFVSEKPVRSEIRAAYKEFVAAFAKAAPAKG